MRRQVSVKRIRSPDGGVSTLSPLLVSRQELPSASPHDPKSNRSRTETSTATRDNIMSAFPSTYRDLRRIASLYNGVAVVQLLAMHWEQLVDFHLAHDNWLDISAQTCRKPIAEAPLFGHNDSNCVKGTVVSVNRCVSVINWNTAWLAYAVEGNFSVPFSATSVYADICRSGR